jgi:hypothetical protein
MIEIAGGIVLAIAFLCALPFLLAAAMLVFYVIAMAVALFGWVPLMGVGWWLAEQDDHHSAALWFTFGATWLLCVLSVIVPDWWKSRKLSKPAPPPSPAPSETPRRGFALPPMGWKPSP